MARNYYYLVAGLREFAIDTDTKGFDAAAIRDEISEELQPVDRQYLRELYTFYDITNIITLWNKKENFNKLGNFSREELEQELEQPEYLPKYIADVILAYKNQIKEDKYNEIDETIDTDVPIEHTLWTRFYAACAESGGEFIRKWYEFDRELRNVSAAYTARAIGREIAPELIGTGDFIVNLTRNSAMDFGLKGEIGYLDQLIQILEAKNMIEKERRLDQLRWDQAEEMTDFDYFNMNKILAYCIKINIIQRWMVLDKKTGEEMFRRLISELTGKEILNNAVNNMDTGS